ncbi:PREDICTED: 65-kDa microtubule-associated protein 8 [Nicotiana attenuata]|uniref:65-kDa microtubule-associated protein 8 n=1 Tax=Nicotiana attenuata TaxID=49451 RepID=A0A314L7Q6_NICAT|nr:PREDICTED: 65-kDa microtubule-associated protein 8 [Nicotiana attenuata]OIT37109.1 65-kda microtubule-associated protein 8 [Nicotiana attenuata]
MGSVQVPLGIRSSALLETSCGYLLQELQIIWDEVGEDQFEREKVLVDIEQECLEVYRRKVDNANISRARLHQELADSEAEFTHLLLLLDERSLPGRPEKMTGTLKEQLESIAPALREMRIRKEERVKQFRAVQGQIQKISAEIAGQSEYNDSLSNILPNGNDLSLKKLEEFQNELQRLQNEKIERLQKVENYISMIRCLAATLGTDSSLIITKVHPSLNELSGLSKNISDSILEKLDSTVQSLEADKRIRLEKLQQLGKALTNLWNLMDTSQKDRVMFSNVTALISLSSEDISIPGSLTLDIIQQAGTEVRRLDQLKASKMKELFLRKQIELEEICKRSHMEIPSRPEMENIIKLMNSGEIDHADLLTSMDKQISQAQEEASSRKAIMEKVEKWILARDEERWLEEYSRDDNRYSVSRGAHKNLRRAERARVMVNKIPALVDMLIAKTKSWEEERKKPFVYDEVPLLAMLEEYNFLRKERDEEKQRQREKKKAPNQVSVGQENLFVLRPSTSSNRISGGSINGGFNKATPLNRKSSLGIQQLGSTTINTPQQSISLLKEAKKEHHRKILTHSRFAFHPGDDSASVVSSFSGPFSP